MLRALSYLGLCFMHKGLPELAVSRFREALARVEGFTETSKELLYNLGSAYEQMGKKEEARAQYEKVYERDITFRNVKAKLETLYKEARKAP
jgi:tetratricopeptide (TPR) repeat protein